MAKFKIGVIILSLIFLLSLLFASPGESDMSKYLLSPSLAHPFGFDSFGRDLFSRSLYASIISLLISATSTLLSSLLALILVFLSIRIPIIKCVIYSFSKAIRTLPTIILALFVLSLSDSGLYGMIFTFVLSGSAGLYLILLPLLLRAESEEYIIAERSLGMRESKIFYRHIIPELFPIIRANGAGTMISFILSESSLSFLGLCGDVSLPTLGRLIADGRQYILTYPLLIVGPGIILFLISLSLLLISQGLSNSNPSSH